MVKSENSRKPQYIPKHVSPPYQWAYQCHRYIHYYSIQPSDACSIYKRTGYAEIVNKQTNKQLSRQQHQHTRTHSHTSCRRKFKQKDMLVAYK